MTERAKKVLFGVSGSVAAIKAPQIVTLLQESGFDVRVISTESAMHFLDPKDFENVEFYRDCDEWSAWKGRGDPVLHIELRKWADAMLIAPLSANTLAKLSSGICDNLLTCVARAWDFERPILVAPAMNTLMWNHPVTAAQIRTLKSWGYLEVPPISKTLMCNDTGMGAMAEPKSIVDALREKIN